MTKECKDGGDEDTSVIQFKPAERLERTLVPRVIDGVPDKPEKAVILPWKNSDTRLDTISGMSVVEELAYLYYLADQRSGRKCLQVNNKGSDNRHQEVVSKTCARLFVRQEGGIERTVGMYLHNVTPILTSVSMDLYGNTLEQVVRHSMMRDIADFDMLQYKQKGAHIEPDRVVYQYSLLLAWAKQYRTEAIPESLWKKMRNLG